MAHDLTFEELYADLVAASTRTLPPDYFTIARYAGDTGMSERVALKVLMDQAEAGEVETKLAVVDGHKARIFWFAEEEDKCRQENG